MDLPDKTAPIPGQPAAKKKIEAVVPAGVTKKVGRPATRRFFDFLFAESPKELAKKVGKEVVVPRMKQGAEQAFNEFVAGMFWGRGGQRPADTVVQGTVLRAGGSAYSQISTQNAMLQARQALPTDRTTGNYQDLIVPTRQYAEGLLANMIDLLNEYRVVSVADLHEAASLTPSISDNSFGWTSFDGARITPDRNGYRLELPRPTLI